MQEPFSTTALEEALEVEGAREVLESFLDDTAGVVDRIGDRPVLPMEMGNFEAYRQDHLRESYNTR